MRVDQSVLQNIGIRLGLLKSRLGPVGGTQTFEAMAIGELAGCVHDLVQALQQGVEWDDLAPRPAPIRGAGDPINEPRTSSGHPDVLVPKDHMHIWAKESGSTAAMEICIHCGERRFPEGANKRT